MKFGFGAWIVVLLIQLLWFASVLDEPHGVDDLIFIMTTVVVTLTIGVTGLFIFRQKA